MKNKTKESLEKDGKMYLKLIIGIGLALCIILIWGIFMNIDIIFKIAGIGILTAVINQILKISGKEEISTFVTLAGIIIVLFSITGMISDLFTSIKTLFTIY